MDEHDITTCTINHGVIEGEHPLQWRVGVNSRIKYQVINPSGDWRNTLPTGELQHDPNAPGKDRWNCTNQGVGNAEEIPLIYYWDNGLLPMTHMRFLRDDGYLDENDNPNVSERFNAILSGTVPGQGNWVWKPNETRRTEGAIPQSMFPEEPTISNEEYYDRKKITPEMLAQGKKYLKYFGWAYEVLPDTNPETLKHHLKHGPLQVVIPGHLVVHILCNSDVDKFYFDSYKPFIKPYAPQFQVAYKGVLEVKNMYELWRADKDVYSIADGTKSMVFNYSALKAAYGSKAEIKPVTQAELDAIPDSGITLVGAVNE